MGGKGKLFLSQESIMKKIIASLLFASMLIPVNLESKINNEFKLGSVLYAKAKYQYFNEGGAYGTGAGFNMDHLDIFDEVKNNPEFRTKLEIFFGKMEYNYNKYRGYPTFDYAKGKYEYNLFKSFFGLETAFWRLREALDYTLISIDQKDGLLFTDNRIRNKLIFKLNDSLNIANIAGFIFNDHNLQENILMSLAYKWIELGGGIRIGKAKEVLSQDFSAGKYKTYEMKPTVSIEINPSIKGFELNAEALYDKKLEARVEFSYRFDIKPNMKLITGAETMDKMSDNDKPNKDIYPFMGSVTRITWGTTMAQLYSCVDNTANKLEMIVELVGGIPYDDQSDGSRTPQQTLINGGQCVDKARFAQDLLQHAGYQAEVAGIQGILHPTYGPNDNNSGGHSIAVFKDEQGYWNILDTDNILLGKNVKKDGFDMKNLEDLVSYAYPGVVTFTHGTTRILKNIREFMYE